MITNEYLQLEKIFSPEVLWEICPRRIKGQVRKKLPGNKEGYIKPAISIAYPNGQVMGEIYSDELEGFGEGDLVIFTMKDASKPEKARLKQPNLQQACAIEFDFPGDDIPDAFDQVRIISLGNQLEKLIKGTEEEIQYQIRRQVAERTNDLDIREKRLKGQEKELDNKEKQLNGQSALLSEKADELEKREDALETAIAEQIAARKYELDFREENLKQREAEIQEQVSEIENLRQAVEGERLALARARAKFQKEGGEEFSKVFALLADDTNSDIPSAPDVTPPNDLSGTTCEFLEKQGYSIDAAVSTQFLLSIVSAAVTGQFVVLSGPTGVGKTSMVNTFAAALGAGYGVVPVRPAWIDPTDLLGFYNPQQSRYQASQFMDRFLDARQYSEANRLYFLTLDEMNLSRVENYAADFLSRLEKARAGEENASLSLYSKDIETHLKIEAARPDVTGEKDLKSLAIAVNHLLKYPSSMKIPDGLVMFGTINLDETTHHLSPKFLDRSFVINVPPHELVEKITDWSGGNAQVPPYFELSLKTVKSLAIGEEKLSKEVQTIWDELLHWQENFIRPLGIHLGFRFSQMYVTFMHIAFKLGIEPRAAASAFFKSKLLPWISFHKDDLAVGEPAKTKLDVLQAWAEDISLTEYPEEYGLKSALERIVERSSNAVVVQYLE